MNNKSKGSKTKYSSTNLKKSNFQELITRAENRFEVRDYKNALRLYSFILIDYPDSQEAKIGASLSDMALESESEAVSLFTYFQALKGFKKNPFPVMEELIEIVYNLKRENSPIDFDQAVEEFFKSLEGVQNSITYEDFLEIIKDSNNFKRSLENIMFSTKIIIKNKKEFIDFVTKLIEFGYKDVALHYLDDLADNFGVDKDIIKLYELAKVGKESED